MMFNIIFSQAKSLPFFGPKVSWLPNHKSTTRMIFTRTKSLLSTKNSVQSEHKNMNIGILFQFYKYTCKRCHIWRLKIMMMMNMIRYQSWWPWGNCQWVKIIIEATLIINQMNVAHISINSLMMMINWLCCWWYHNILF